MEQKGYLMKTINVLNKFSDILNEQETAMKSGPESEQEKELRTLFEQRVHSYIPSLWPLKPPSLSPLTCARYGWKCVSRDTLSCVTCGELFVIRLDKSYVAPKSYEASVLNFEECLLQKHKKLCPWKYNPINESIFALSWSNYDEAFSWIKNRLVSLLSIEKEIPSDIACATIGNECMPAVLRLFKNDEELNKWGDEELEKCLILALNGWSSQGCLSESKKEGVSNLTGKGNLRRSILRCHVCLRTIGLWNYYPRAKLVALHNKSQVDENAMFVSGNASFSEDSQVGPTSLCPVDDSEAQAKLFERNCSDSSNLFLEREHGSSNDGVFMAPNSCTISNWSMVNNAGDETLGSDTIFSVESGVDDESRLESSAHQVDLSTSKVEVCSSSDSSIASITDICHDISNSDAQQMPEIESSISTSDTPASLVSNWSMINNAGSETPKSDVVLDVESESNELQSDVSTMSFINVSTTNICSSSDSSPASITEICRNIDDKSGDAQKLQQTSNDSSVSLTQASGDATTQPEGEVDHSSAQLASHIEDPCELKRCTEEEQWSMLINVSDTSSVDDVSSTSGQNVLNQSNVSGMVQEDGISASDDTLSQNTNTSMIVDNDQMNSVASFSHEQSRDKDEVFQLHQEKMLSDDAVLMTTDNLPESVAVNDMVSREGFPSLSSTPLFTSGGSNLSKRHLNSTYLSPLESTLTLQADKLHWNWCPWSASCENTVTRKLLRCLLNSEESSFREVENKSVMVDEFDEPPRSKRRSLEQHFLHVSRIMRQIP